MNEYSLTEGTSPPGVNRRLGRWLTIPVIAASAVALSVAEAAPIAVRVSDTLSTPPACYDGTSCDVTSSQDGVVTMSQAIDNWFVTVTTGVGYGVNGQDSPSDPYLHLNNITFVTTPPSPLPTR